MSNKTEVTPWSHRDLRRTWCSHLCLDYRETDGKPSLVSSVLHYTAFRPLAEGWWASFLMTTAPGVQRPLPSPAPRWCQLGRCSPNIDRTETFERMYKLRGVWGDIYCLILSCIASSPFSMTPSLSLWVLGGLRPQTQTTHPGEHGGVGHSLVNQILFFPGMGVIGGGAGASQGCVSPMYPPDPPVQLFLEVSEESVFFQ